METQISLTAAEAGLRLDVALANVTGLSRSHWTKRLKEHAVLQAGQPIPASHIVVGNESLTVLPESSQPEASVPNVPIVYQDDDLLIIDKPAGLLVHAAPGGTGQPTVAAFAASHTSDDDAERPGIVHRLDRETSGLLVVAKTKESKSQLQAAFKERQVRKAYLALVVGRLEPDQATISLPISRKPGTPTKRAVVASGKPAQTAYRVLSHYPGYTYLEARPQTGRTHQLRVHFAALGHPIAGDTLYGAQPVPGLPRHFLHAASLEFDGPSGQHIQVSSPLPTELAGLLETLQNTV